MLQRLMLSAALVSAISLSANAQFVHAMGTKLVDGSGKPLQLRGLNLGNWLVTEGYMFHFDKGPQSTREIEAVVNDLLGPAAATNFWTQYRNNYVTKKDIDAIKEAGFNSLRVPIHYRYFTVGNNLGFDLLDRLVSWAKADGIVLILDLHCAPGGQTGANIDDSWGYPWLFESPEARMQTTEIWQRIAAHYRNEPTIAGYDLLNEPIPNYPALAHLNPLLEPLYRDLSAAIRKVDAHHTLILGGAQWDTNFTIFGPPFDHNVMYTFHKYWAPPTQAVIDQYLEFSNKYMGESGENTDDWITRFTAVLEDNQLSWAYWPYKKMSATSSMATFDEPIYWDEIVKYAALHVQTGDTKNTIPQRPPQQHIVDSFHDLLQKVQFHNCHTNPAYLKALGMKG
jgi:endoglucanase